MLCTLVLVELSKKVLSPETDSKRANLLAIGIADITLRGLREQLHIVQQRAVNRDAAGGKVGERASGWR